MIYLGNFADAYILSSSSSFFFLEDVFDFEKMKSKNTFFESVGVDVKHSIYISRRFLIYISHLAWNPYKIKYAI